jgi:hypothetical protein
VDSDDPRPHETLVQMATVAAGAAGSIHSNAAKHFKLRTVTRSTPVNRSEDSAFIQRSLATENLRLFDKELGTLLNGYVKLKINDEYFRFKCDD